VPNLSMNVSYITPSIMRVKIGAPGRWEFPMSILNTTIKQGKHLPLNMQCALQWLTSVRCASSVQVIPEFNCSCFHACMHASLAPSS
jgi:hypothetical protein